MVPEALGGPLVAANIISLGTDPTHPSFWFGGAIVRPSSAVQATAFMQRALNYGVFDDWDFPSRYDVSDPSASAPEHASAWVGGRAPGLGDSFPRSHSISFTGAQCVPECKVGVGRKMFGTGELNLAVQTVKIVIAGRTPHTHFRAGILSTNDGVHGK